MTSKKPFTMPTKEPSTRDESLARSGETSTRKTEERLPHRSHASLVSVVVELSPRKMSEKAAKWLLSTLVGSGFRVLVQRGKGPAGPVFPRVRHEGYCRHYGEGCPSQGDGWTGFHSNVLRRRIRSRLSRPVHEGRPDWTASTP